MTTFAEAHAQHMAEFGETLKMYGFHAPWHDPHGKTDAAVERLHRLWTAKPLADPVMDSPIRHIWDPEKHPIRF